MEYLKRSVGIWGKYLHMNYISRETPSKNLDRNLEWCKKKNATYQLPHTLVICSYK